MIRILVTNDDGVYSPGLVALVGELKKLGKVTAVVPHQERSSVSHSLTLHAPLRINRFSDNIFITTGTPSDCVLIGLFDVLKKYKPDIVVSGINIGPNLGDDITYSGTVAASIEATMRGVASFAVSVASFSKCRYDVAAKFSYKLSKYILENGLPGNTFLNVNVPNVPPSKIRGVKITRLGKRIYKDTLVKRHDPRGGVYYWIGGAEPASDIRDGTDTASILKKYISVTPVHLDLTNYKLIEELHSWNIRFP